jgi:hypothetical protein
METAMSHAFISYSKQNKDYARRLADYLLDHGFDIWIDDRIDYGENWLDTMFQAVVECAAFVVVMTPEARQSRWVQREVAWADEREKKFFPVLLNGDNWPIFVLTQYADVSDGSLPDPGFIQELSEYVPSRLRQGTDVAQQTGHGQAADLGSSISPEAQRLLDIMLNPNVPPEQRAEAGRTLADIGDPRPGVGLRDDGVPDIDWVEIPEGEFIYQDGERLHLPTFWIARYPVTYTQFQVFLDAGDGFSRNEWWDGLTPEYRKQEMSEQRYKYSNHPRDRVSWYQAVAFCRWLSAKLGYEFRPPTEQEWEKAARGTDGREYPWGAEYISGYANVDEVNSDAGPYYLKQTTTVGIYPQGASPYGLLDVSGNVWEWCLNEHDTPENTSFGGSESRVLRGGSWDFNIVSARCASRGWYDSPDRHYYGFRVCAVSRPK